MTFPAFRLATFNVESLGERPEHAPLPDRIQVLRPQLERLNADILCLQEVDGQKDQGPDQPRRMTALDALLAETPYADFHRVVSQNAKGTGPRDRHNLVTLSRFPILDHAQIHHDWVTPPNYRPVTAYPVANEAVPVPWDRPFLRTSIELAPHQVLHVFNLHLRAPRAAFIEGQKESAQVWRSVSGWAEGFFLAAMKSAGQALEVRLGIDKLMDDYENPLVAVCGDLNAGDAKMGNWETAMNMICGDEEDLGAGDMVARLLTPLERALPESQRYSVLHSGRPIMADHVLASRTLMAHFRTMEIHNEMLGDEFATPAVVKGPPESFHAPLVAQFSANS